MIFAIAAFLGWCMESFTSLFYPETKKLVNRGFLIGPYLPVYGLGVAGISFALQSFKDNIPLLFLLSMVLCTCIEYCTSYILEKIFHARWWDYSNQKFNINGRVYVVNMFLFGIAGIVIVEVADPILFSLLEKIPDFYMHVASGIFLAVILLDTIISSIIAFGLKHASNEVTDELAKDSTLEVNEERKEITANIANKTKKTIETTAAKTKKTIVDTAVKTKKTIADNTAKTRKTIVDTTVKTRGKIVSTASKTKQTIANTASKIKGIKPIPLEELQSKIKERFASQSKWSNRLTRAFPTMKISFPHKNKPVENDELTDISDNDTALNNKKVDKAKQKDNKKRKKKDI